MALTNCKECKKEISDKAKTCPHCGTQLNTNIGCGPLIGFAIIATILILVFADKDSSPPLESTQNTAVNTQTAKVLPIQTINSWKYQKSDSDISGKLLSGAILLSNNTIDLEFPYQGGTYARIIVRNHPRHGKDIVFAVNKGQLNCQYDNCYINLKFDNGKVIKNYVTKPDDGSSLAYFLSNYNKIIKQIKKSKTMFVEVTFFQQGTHTFEFNVENIDLSKI